MKHSFFSASASFRWLNCTASLLYPAINTRSSASDEGTEMHALAEHCLVDGTDCDNPYVQSFVDYVRSVEGEALYEQVVHYDDIAPNGFGTSDVIKYDKSNSTLHIIDLKYGMYKVDAERNTQLLLYAHGARKLYPNASKFVLHIFQPRIFNNSTFTVSANYLKGFAAHVKSTVDKYLKGEMQFAPSQKVCHFCSGKMKCPAYEKAKLDDLNALELTAHAVHDLSEITTSDDVLVGLYRKGKMIAAEMAAIEQELLNRAQMRDVKGISLKFVKGRRTVDKERLASLGNNDVYMKVPKTLGELEKVLDKDTFDMVLCNSNTTIKIELDNLPLLED